MYPPGVTKRSIDTLISRRVSPFAVSGVAVVCCLHHREKRVVTEAAFPTATGDPHLCPCCENLFPSFSDDPMTPCPACTPRRLEAA